MRGNIKYCNRAPDKARATLHTRVEREAERVMVYTIYNESAEMQGILLAISEAISLRTKDVTVHTGFDPTSCKGPTNSPGFHGFGVLLNPLEVSSGAKKGEKPCSFL